MNRFAIAFAGVFALTSAAFAQEAITIKLRTRAEGDVVAVTKSETVVSKVRVADGKGNVLVDQIDNKGTTTTAYTETMLQREGTKPPTKLQREYSKAQIKKGDDVENLEMQGKTVVIEKSGDKYAYSYKDGTPVSGKSATTLAAELNRKAQSDANLEKMMLPQTAVKVGDSWKLDMAPILKELFKDGKDAEMDVDAAKAVGSGKLVKTYKKGNQLFGELQYSMALPLKSMGKAAAKMDFNAGAKMTLDMKLDTCIDGTSETGNINVKMSLNGTASLAQLPGSIATISVQSDTIGTQADAKK